MQSRHKLNESKGIRKVIIQLYNDNGKPIIKGKYNKGDNYNELCQSLLYLYEIYETVDSDYINMKIVEALKEHEKLK